jgi:hypothetical protein
MSEDPKLFDAGDYNLYRYCHNDPLDATDPMGTQIMDLFARIWAPPPQQASAQQNAASQSSQMGNIYMRRADAIAKYGAYDGNGRWSNESRWITDYRIPKNVLNDPNYNWRWSKDIGGGLVTHFPVNRDIVPALTKALNNLQQAGHLGDLHTLSMVRLPREILVVAAKSALMRTALRSISMQLQRQEGLERFSRSTLELRLCVPDLWMEEPGFYHGRYAIQCISLWDFEIEHSS